MENSINVYRENKLNEFRESLSSSRGKAEQIRVRLLVFLSFMERLGEGENKEKVIEDIREQLKNIDGVINDIRFMDILLIFLIIIINRKLYKDYNNYNKL